MAQNNDHTFFDEAGLYISQHRFITREGDTFATSALRRAFMSEEREAGCRTTLVTALFGCLALAGGISLMICLRTIIFAGAKIAASAGIESAFNAVEERTGERTGEEIISSVLPDTTWQDYTWVIVVTVLGLVAIGVGALGIVRTMKNRRRRYMAVFMFGPDTVGGALTRHEYVVRDYDGDLVKRLIAAANEAIAATQRTQGSTSAS